MTLLYVLTHFLVLFAHSNHGIRRTEKVYSQSSMAKAMSGAGVQLINYRLNVYDWNIILKPGHTDVEVHSLCHGQCNQEGHPDEGGADFLSFHGNEVDVERLVLDNPGVVDLVEPDQPISIIPEADAVQGEHPLWNLDRIGMASQANRGAGVHVYVFDTGIRSSHTDFGGRAIPTMDFTKPSKECNGSALCAEDLSGHGTHCAGIAAGNTYGIASSATLRAVKVLGDDGRGKLSSTLAAIDWIVARGSTPAVISMSLGSSGIFAAYLNPITAAIAKGITVVTAAGNANADSCTCSPAYLPDVITVAAADSHAVRSPFSNWGQCNDIFAPGTGIQTASHISDTGSATLSGTSMACPHVSGAAALLLEANASLNSRGVLAKLIHNAKRGIIQNSKSAAGDPDAFLWVGFDMSTPLTVDEEMEAISHDNTLSTLMANHTNATDGVVHKTAVSGNGGCKGDLSKCNKNGNGPSETY